MARSPLHLATVVLFALICLMSGTNAWFIPDRFRCLECTNVTLTNTGHYAITGVPRAAKIRSIRLLEETSISTCIPDETFGFYGPREYTDGGCSGVFRVCYTRGMVKDVQCASSEYQRFTCEVGCRIMSIAIKEQQSRSPCVEGFSFRAVDDEIEVSKGCRATFMVGCRSC